MSSDFVGQWLRWAQGHLAFVRSANLEDGSLIVERPGTVQEVLVRLDRGLFTDSTVESLARMGTALRFRNDPAHWAIADWLETALLVETDETDLRFEFGEAPGFYPTPSMDA